MIAFDNSEDQTRRTKIDIALRISYLLSLHKLVTNRVPIIDKGLLPHKLNSQKLIARINKLEIKLN